MFSSSWRRPCISATKASVSVASGSATSASAKKSVQLVEGTSKRFAASNAKGGYLDKAGSSFRNVNANKNKKTEMMEQRQSNYIKVISLQTEFFGPVPEGLLVKVREVEEMLDQQSPYPKPPSLAEMNGLPVIGKGVITPKLVGKAVEFSVESGSPLKSFGVPRATLLDFRLLAKPCSIVREATVDILDKLKGAGSKPSLDSRWVMTGPLGCGKSYLMLQAVAHCATNGWIVWYIPRASRMVDSSTPFAYDPQTQIFLQASYAQQTLRRLLEVNPAALGSIRLEKDVELEKRKSIPARTSLAEVIEVAVREQHHSPALLVAVMERLGQQIDYPVLLAVDDLQSLYRKTQYRNQHYEHIQPFHLSMPRLLMEFASGKRQFARGAFLGALSLSNTHHPVSVELRDALQLTEGRPISPYEKRSPGLLEYLQGLKPLPVPAQLGRNEAASVFDVWTANHSLHSHPNDELFLSKFSEAGGNARAFVHGGLLASLNT